MRRERSLAYAIAYPWLWSVYSSTILDNILEEMPQCHSLRFRFTLRFPRVQEQERPLLKVIFRMIYIYINI